MIGVLHSLLQASQSLHGFSGHGFTIFFEATLKGTFFLLFAAGLTLALRRCSAASRHLVWTLALGVTLVLPIVSLTVPTWKVPLISSTLIANVGERTTMRKGVAADSQNPQADATDRATRQSASEAYPTPTGLPWFRWILSM